MAGKPADASASHPCEDARRERSERDAPPADGDGPLAVERLVKPDGRALILYTRSPSA